MPGAMAREGSYNEPLWRESSSIAAISNELHRWRLAPRHLNTACRVDVLETADAVEVVADLPGVTPESVEVTINGGNCGRSPGARRR